MAKKVIIAQLAFHDMMVDNNERGIVTYDATTQDRWVVDIREVYTKETTILNRKLGIAGINRGKHNMARRINK